MGCRLSRCITPVTDDDLVVQREYSLPQSIKQENQPHSLVENILPGSVPVPVMQSTEYCKSKPDQDSDTMESVLERSKWKGKEGTRKQAPKTVPQQHTLSMKEDQADERRSSCSNEHADWAVVSSTATSSMNTEKEETTATDNNRETRKGSIISEPSIKKPLPESRIPKPKFTYQPRVVQGRAAASASDCPQQGKTRTCAYSKREEARNERNTTEPSLLPESRIPRPKFTYRSQGQVAARAPDCPQQRRLSNNKWEDKRNREAVKKSLPESHIPKPRFTYRMPVQRTTFASGYSKPEKKQPTAKLTKVQPFNKPSAVTTAMKTLKRPLISRNRIYPRGAVSDRRPGMAHPVNQRPSFPYSMHMLPLPKILSEMSSLNYEMMREECPSKKKEGLMMMEYYINLQIELRLRLLKEYNDVGINHNPLLKKEIQDLDIVKENIRNAVEDVDWFIQQASSTEEDLLPF